MSKYNITQTLVAGVMAGLLFSVTAPAMAAQNVNKPVATTNAEQKSAGFYFIIANTLQVKGESRNVRYGVSSSNSSPLFPTAEICQKIRANALQFTSSIASSSAADSAQPISGVSATPCVEMTY